MNKLLFTLLIFISGCSVKPVNNAHTLQIKQIETGVYMHTSYKHYESYDWVDSNGLVVVNGKQAIMIDTPWSEAETIELNQWITSQGFTLIASISTHFHEDRTAGIAWLNSKSIPTYTSELTNKILKKNNKPTATNVFQGDHLALLDGLLEVYYPGEGHSKDNLVVWLPEYDLLFGGCLVRSLKWHSLGNIADANVNQWANSVRNVQVKYPTVKKIVPGHGNVGNESILNHTIEVADKVID